MKGCIYYTKIYKDSHLDNGMWLYSFVFRESQVRKSKTQDEVMTKFN